PFPDTIYRLDKPEGSIRVTRTRHLSSFIKWRDGFESSRYGYKPTATRLGNPLPACFGFWHQRFAIFQVRFGFVLECGKIQPGIYQLSLRLCSLQMLIMGFEQLRSIHQYKAR